MTPLIIEAAINGGTPRSHNPHVPITPDEVVADALACMEAGASVIHSHIEDLRLLGRAGAERYLEAYRAIVAAQPDAILCPTAGVGGSLEERWAHTELMAEAGLIRMSVLDPGSVNIANSGDDGLPGPSRGVYVVPFDEIEYLLALMDRHRLGPSIAIYDPSYLQATLAYERGGRMPPGGMVKFYFAGDHSFRDFVKGGFRYFGLNPTRKALDAYVEMMEGSSLHWSVAVPGGDVTLTGLTRLAIEQGGHVRVGLEDHAADGPKPTNRTLIEQVVEIARACGREVADCATAARILGLPRA
jgi:3-keto-5-aminohexanoate cleavage enzyme